MATLPAGTLNLIDLAKRLDPETNAVSVQIAELLSQTNDILLDMQWKAGNLETGHRLVMRTGLPAVTWRKLNQGIDPSKSTTAQVDETCGMLEGKSVIDKDLALLNGNTGAFRMSEQEPFYESMNQTVATTLFYGDHTLNPEQFLGIAPRFSAISGATNGQNVLDALGVGTDNTSIYLIGWGNKSVYGIVPKNSKAGLQHLPVQDGSGDGCTEVADANSKNFRAYVDRYQWKCGLAVPDWRYIVRIANIDVSNLVGESSNADLIKLMSRAMDRLPNFEGITPVFYANRTVFSMLRIQALNKTMPSALGIDQALDSFGKSRRTLNFQGIPVRKVDQILNTEARIT